MIHLSDVLALRYGPDLRGSTVRKKRLMQESARLERVMAQEKYLIRDVVTVVVAAVPIFPTLPQKAAFRRER